MIRTKVEKCGGGVMQELDAKGTTRTLLIELRALNIGVLSSLSLIANGEEMPMDKRIELFCDILKIKED